MMKKMLALILSLALLLGCAAMAEEANAAEKQNLGTITVNGAFSLRAKLPEGYQVSYKSVTNDLLIAVMTKEDTGAPIMTLSVGFDESYADVARMNDLNAEELELIEKTFTDVDPTTDISYAETKYGTLLLVAKQLEKEVDYLELVSVYKGYFIEFAVTASPYAEDRNLTEEQIWPCVEFLSDLDFVDASEEASSIDVAGKTLMAVMEDYNETRNTVSMTLMEPVSVSAEMVDALEVGDHIVLNGDNVEIEAISTDEYGQIIINDNYYLTKNPEKYGFDYDPNGNYAYLETLGTVDIIIPDSAVFLDQVAQGTFEELEEPVQRTAAEFIQMLTAHDEADPGFDGENVSVTFDANGVLTRIFRFYAPWH